MDEPGFGKALAPASERALFRVSGVKWRIWPLVIAILLGYGLPLVGEAGVLVVQHFVPLPDLPLFPWMELYYESAGQLVLAIAVIVVLKGFLRRDFGLHAPRDDGYVAPALMLGLLLGLAMTAVNHWSDIAAHHAPSGAYELVPANVAGWVSYQGFFSPLSDEILWRGLLVTYLAAMISGRITIRRFDMSIAVPIVALIFAFSYIGGFIGYPFTTALLRMLVAFLEAMLFGYWFDKSKSLVAPVVGHGACFGLSQILIFAMVAAWG